MRTTGDVGPVNASHVTGAADAFRCVLTAAMCRLWARFLVIPSALGERVGGLSERQGHRGD